MMKLIDAHYIELLITQWVRVHPYAEQHGVGVRVALLHDRPLVVATPDIPAGLVELMEQAS